MSFLYEKKVYLCAPYYFIVSLFYFIGIHILLHEKIHIQLYYSYNSFV